MTEEHSYPSCLHILEIVGDQRNKALYFLFGVGFRYSMLLIRSNAVLVSSM